ncbi:MAG: hypothetical protein E4H38_03110 [Gemmatimonadales bacterium]|nr:MAG: hypothetical protein E4H38_03110 [Gemmatimonadales bacterium]
MHSMDGVCRRVRPWLVALALLVTSTALIPVTVLAQDPATMPVAAEHRPGGEVNLQLPDLASVDFLGFTGHEILLSGLFVCVLGLLFGLWSYAAVKKLPVHKAMADVSDIIYETCKAYMVQQGKFLMGLWLFVSAVTSSTFWSPASGSRRSPSSCSSR